jgi:hypothetical protein
MSEITITEKTLEPAISLISPKMPAIAWQGLFSDYRELVADTTEAADAFHFATFLQVFGCTIGRSLFVYHATRLYPNFFVCLVGRSGLTRKDTAWSRGSDILNRLFTYPDDERNPPFRVVKGIRSYEGLLDELSGVRKVRLIQVGELLSILAKAKQDSLGNIIPALTELYDSPDILNPPVHQKEVKPSNEPFLSIMAGTTQDWLQKALTEQDIYGGFANRWLYFSGAAKDPLPNPAKVNPSNRNKLVSNLNEIREWAESVPDGEILISPEAAALFENYYREHYRRCQEPGLIPTLIVRIQDFIWKMALLYAANNKSTVISANHIEAAMAVGTYLEESVKEVFSSFGMSNGKAQEMKLLHLLRTEGRPMSLRDIYRRLNMSARDLDNLAAPLLKIALIKTSPQNNKSGRSVKRYELV